MACGEDVRAGVVSDDDMEMTYQEFLEGKSTTPHGMRRRGVAVSYARRARLRTHAHTHARTDPRTHAHTHSARRAWRRLALVRVVASAPAAVCGASLNSRGRLMLPAVGVQA